PSPPLALRSMDGVFLSPTEDEFVGRIAEELEHFMLQGQHQRVLLFPPLSSRLRYLIHRTVENMELLSSFSVGEGWRRRTVICHSAVRLPNEATSDQKPGSNPARCQQRAQPWGGRGGRGARPRHPGDTHGDNSRCSVGSGRISRPPRRKADKALYVPKGIRRKGNWRERESDGDAAPGGENRPKNPTGDAQEEAAEGGGSPGKLREAEEENVPEEGGAEHPLKQNSQGDPGSFSTPENAEQESPDTAQVEKKPLENLLEGPGEAVAAPQLLPGGDPGGKVPREEEEEEEKEEKEGSDVAEAPSGDLAAGDREGTRQSGLEDECGAELLAEIVGNLTVKDVSVERISVDCCSYGEPQLSEGDLGHVTEIYDFPSALKTEDLLGIFADFHESGFKIQWVDDTHALGIFSSLSTASQALGRRYPCLKIRPLIHASKQSKAKALQRPKLLQLGKERPQTDTAVARRLVSHALGWRHRQQQAAGDEAFQPESLDQEQ
ncbi:R3HC1 protein, partial [Brachypodius atriceps]|nr:R3HC1 protein [Brachypodius atriceps]